MKIAVRKTRKNEYLVCEAKPYTLGVGVQKVGIPAGGYTTGFQFASFPNENDAVAYAEEMTINTPDYELVEWEQAGEKNQQFNDLPKLYPTKEPFDNPQQAKESGWIYISPSKTIDYYRGVTIYCADVTRHPWFGYKLAITTDLDSTRLFLVSTEIQIGEKFSIRFRMGSVVDAIDEIKGYIDAELITQSQAVSEGAPSIQAVNNAIREGALDSFFDQTQRVSHGCNLVSKTQVRRRWGGSSNGD